MNPRPLSGVAQFAGATMLTNTSNLQKTGGTDSSGAVEENRQKIVALRSGRKITVNDAVWSCDNSLLRLCIEGDGIDCTVPREHVELVIKATTGEEVMSDGSQGLSKDIDEESVTNSSGDGVIDGECKDCNCPIPADDTYCSVCADQYWPEDDDWMDDGLDVDGDDDGSVDVEGVFEV